MPRTELAPKTQSVPSLHRALAIFEFLSSSKSGMTLQELVHATALPRSSVHCLLLTLQRQGYVHHNDRTSRYMLGLKFFSLANAALSGVKLREQAAPFLVNVLRKTGLTTHLAIREQHEIVLIAKYETPGMFRLATWLGKRMEAHCTGLGKAMLAHMPEAQLEEMLRSRGLPRHNENTIVSTPKVKEELARVRSQGYALDDEEDEVGLRCIGVPVFDETGQAVAAISVAGTILQITRENTRELAAIVMEAAESLSRCLGYFAERRAG
jgi:DNA-binding IclR family transcriptional regulator